MDACMTTPASIHESKVTVINYHYASLHQCYIAIAHVEQ